MSPARDAWAAAAEIRDGSLTAAEAVADALERIDRDDREVNALRQVVRTLEHRVAVDRLVGATDQMQFALKVIDLQALQNDLAGTARARRYPDDRDRARP